MRTFIFTFLGFALVGLEDDLEYQLIVGCNALSIDIENKIVVINSFVCDKYHLKFPLVHHPIDYTHIVKKAFSFGKKSVLFFNIGGGIFCVSHLTIEEGFALPNQRGRPPELQDLVGIHSIQQLVDLPCGLSLLGHFRGTKDAKKLFEELLVRNMVSWNILICVADVSKARAVAFVSEENVRSRKNRVGMHGRFNSIHPDLVFQ
ncbi:U4/U6 small nuclear ribonucleoprotein Prp31 [Spatholobus suberectus]|nr:U4/U6 small nuclear ribonucleoprotein Prp31 [Spatholobus suberectus]